MELSDLKGVKSVKADFNEKTVKVDFEEPATDELIRDTLTEINYPPEE
jgi:copper chaperone CopZ